MKFCYKFINQNFCYILISITPSNFGFKELAPEFNGYDNEITGAQII